MASIRKRNDKWQVQIRRKGCPFVARSFIRKRDAETWARNVEAGVEIAGLYPDARELKELTLGNLIAQYRDSVTIRKRSGEEEGYWLNAFLRHPICARRLSELTTADFAA